MRSILPLSQSQRNLISLFSQHRTLCKTRKNTREFHLHSWHHVFKINEWFLVNCFHREFRISTQIMVHDYCIAKLQKFLDLRRVFNSPLRHFFSRFKTFSLIRTLKELSIVSSYPVQTNSGKLFPQVRHLLPRAEEPPKIPPHQLFESRSINSLRVYIFLGFEP